jgi:hypothetical protein
METTQVLLVLVIAVMTIMLGVIFTQVIIILKEFRKTLDKVNEVLDDTSVISQALSRPVGIISTLASSFKSGSGILKMLTKQGKKE